MRNSNNHLPNTDELAKRLTQVYSDVKKFEELSESISLEKLGLISMQGAADFLGLSLPTLDRMIEDREVPFIEIGERKYFTKHHLMKFFYRQLDDFLENIMQNKPNPW